MTADSSAQATTQATALVDGTFAGTDLHAVYALQRAEIRPPHAVALAELPQVGPHATGVGKLAGMLPLPFELRTYGWQLQRGDRQTAADQVRAASYRTSMIQALADVAQGEPVEHVALRVWGPVAVSVAAMLPGGQRILADAGARAELASAWREGIAATVADIARVLGAHTTVVIQEHDADQVLAGRIRTVSGADVHRALDRAEVRGAWQTVGQLEATVLMDVPSDLAPLAAETGSVLLDWPTGRSAATEKTWELIDTLLRAESPVGLRLSPRGQAQRVAEDLMDAYRDWGLDPSAIEFVRFTAGVHQEAERTVGARLQWLREVTDHANGYLAAG